MVRPCKCNSVNIPLIQQPALVQNSRVVEDDNPLDWFMLESDGFIELYADTTGFTFELLNTDDLPVGTMICSNAVDISGGFVTVIPAMGSGQTLNGNSSYIINQENSTTCFVVMTNGDWLVMAMGESLMSTQYLSVSVTPTIDTNAYSANDVIGGLLTFSLAGLTVEGGIINNVFIVDDDNEKAVLTLYLFNDTPTNIADDAPYTPTVADLKKQIATVVFSTYTTVNTNAFCRVTDINQTFSASGGSIYGYLVCTATPTYTATTDLTIILEIVSE